jgi:hypothetical protein
MTSTEGNPAVEEAERQFFGNENYQKAEVVHRFADTHAWLHPLLGVVAVAVLVCVVLLLRKYFKRKS